MTRSRVMLRLLTGLRAGVSSRSLVPHAPVAAASLGAMSRREEHAPDGSGRDDRMWARGGRRGMFWALIWLVYLGPAFAAAWNGDHGVLHGLVATALLVAFIVLYLFTIAFGWRPNETSPDVWPPPSTRTNYRLLVALAVLALLLVLMVGEPGVAAIVFLAPAAVSVVPQERGPIAIALIALAVAVSEIAFGSSAGGVGGSTFAALAAGGITLGIRRMRIVMHQLEQAREDVRTLAASQERVRIARDLHDLLGHSLTVISVKSQLASRLLERGEIERAAEEVRGVEQVSQSALTEVREVITGYRSRPLAAELAAAEATLSGAGVQVAVEPPSEEVPAASEDALRFVVREGVTNVLRHSRAKHCDISVRHSADTVVLELADDGVGVGAELAPVDAGTDADSGGHGLRGLAERLEAVGGRLSAGDLPDGRHVLRAEVAR